MAPRRSRANSPEFPILEANALYAGKIKGDGNCLFNALSDQLYGNQEMHEVLRTYTIEHMKEHSGFYRQYMAVNSVRRNPKRKTTTALSTAIEPSAYTEEELQRQFELHVEKMGQPGEWADNMEADFTILISPSFDHQYDEPGATDDRPTLHIAYHTWEHYSSVRNNAGPHTGVPDVTVVPQRTSLRKRPSPSVSCSDEDEIPRARKRRSPLPIFDSDSTPEGTESSSDESNGPVLSQTRLDLPESVQVAKPQKLTIKLRCLRTTDSAEPGEAVELVKPVKPVEPVEPVKSLEVVKTIEPVKAVAPVKHIEPVEPVEPVELAGSLAAIPPPTITPSSPLPLAKTPERAASEAPSAPALLTPSAATVTAAKAT